MQMADIGSILAGKTSWGKTSGRVTPESLLTRVQANNLPETEKVDIGSFFPADSTSSGSYGRSFLYQENISSFTADGSLAYEGDDGTKMFIDFSIRSVTKKVRYESTQAADRWLTDEDVHKHPVHDILGPGATAGRIVDFAGGLVNKFLAMEGDDPQKVGAFIRELVQAIKTGFSSLGDLAKNAPGHIGDMVRETFNRVMDGMAGLEQEIDAAGQRARQRTYDEVISYTKASVEISILA